MFALGIRYLTGRAVASDPANLDLAEWPPHPARVFMAMAAAHFETDQDPAEREVLGWIEALPAPRLRASPASPRTVTTRFVPVNDRVTVSKAALQSAPALTRNRAARSFPTVLPEDDSVFLIWDEDLPGHHREALESVCGKVTRIGHSSSLVQMWVAENEEAIEPTLVPDATRMMVRLRTTTSGLLEALEEGYPYVRPTVSTWSGYGKPHAVEEATPGSVFDGRLIILRLEALESGPGRLGLEATARVTRGLRGALLSTAEEPIPEFISGHRADGSPSQRTHLAWIPLADVGHPHADGHLLGIAAVLPEDLSSAERRTCLRAIGRIEDLRLGRLGRWALAPEDRETPPRALTDGTWTRAGDQWASVTPVVYDRFGDDPGEKRDSIAASCERVGLPRPVSVILTGVTPHLGVPHSAQFPPLPAPKGRPQRPFTHVIIDFGEPVEGPIMIGAGRYRGYGLLRPLREG